MTKPMIVALAPSRNVAPSTPPLVASPSGWQLANLIGCEPRDLPELFELHNLLERPAPPAGQARDTELVIGWQERVRPLIQPGQYVITLGRDVTKASGLDFVAPYHYAARTAWSAHGPTVHYEQAWAHHTSGRSYFWNDPNNVAMAKHFWTEVGRLGRAAA